MPEFPWGLTDKGSADSTDKILAADTGWTQNFNITVDEVGDEVFTDRTTTDLTEGSNLYYTDARVDARNAATNVTFDTDTDVSGNDWVLDEDTLSSNSDTKVPTQSSVKAYVDNEISGVELWIYWDGSDGDLVITNGNTTNLNTDQVYQYSSIDVQAWGTLSTTDNTWVLTIKCSWTCTINGTVDLDWKLHAATSNEIIASLTWLTVTDKTSGLGWDWGLAGWDLDMAAWGTGWLFGWGWGWGWTAEANTWTIGWAGWDGTATWWTGWAWWAELTSNGATSWAAGWFSAGWGWSANMENSPGWSIEGWAGWDSYGNDWDDWIRVWSSDATAAWAWGWAGWLAWSKWGAFLLYTKALDWTWTLTLIWTVWGSAWTGWDGTFASWVSWRGAGWGWGGWGGGGWAGWNAIIVFWNNSSSIITTATAWTGWAGWTGWTSNGNSWPNQTNWVTGVTGATGTAWEISSNKLSELF